LDVKNIPKWLFEKFHSKIAAFNGTKLYNRKATLAFYATTRIQQGEKSGRKYYNITTTLGKEGGEREGERERGRQ